MSLRTRYRHLISDPLEQPLDDFRHGPRCIDSDVCICIRHAAPQVELFQLREVGGKRPATIAWNPVDDAAERNIEPRDRAVGKHDRAIIRLDERAAPCRDDDVSLRAAARAEPAARLSGSTASPSLREDRGHRSAFTRLDPSRRCPRRANRSGDQGLRRSSILPAPMNPTR